MEDTSESDETIQSTSESEETMEDSSEEEEMVDFENTEIRQKLQESRVIGRVLNDFMPCMVLNVLYPDKLITLGDELCLHQVQTEPDIHGYGDAEVLEAHRNGRYLIVMTDPGAPGGEYLHGTFFRSVMGSEHHDIDAPWQSLVTHEPPTTAGRMIVFTLFTASEPQSIYVPNSRENFSTRAFADRNAFGPPLSAAFFYIKRENEKKNGNCYKESPRCDGNGRPSHSKSAYALSKPIDTRKLVFKLFKPKQFQPKALSSSLEKKKGG